MTLFYNRTSSTILNNLVQTPTVLCTDIRSLEQSCKLNDYPYDGAFSTNTKRHDLCADNKYGYISESKLVIYLAS